MFRYTALSYDFSSAEATAAADRMNAIMLKNTAGWRLVFETAGMRVYCAGERQGSTEVHKLHNNAGVLLGTVFDRIGVDGSPPQKARFGPAETAHLLDTNGTGLITRYWGNYIAFLRDPADPHSCRIIRSPAGSIDCLTTTIQGVGVYFSTAQHCPLVALREFSIDWDYVAAEISTLVPETRHTGLREMKRILHGECAVVQGDKARLISYWHPFDFVDDSLNDTLTAATAFRQAASACVHAWASCYDSALAMLSGGLDSSIVVGLLSGAPTRPRITCLNYRNRHDTFSDERRYARVVTERCRYRLIEREQDANFSMEPILALPRSASPWMSTYEMGETAHRSELARAHRVAAYFLGHGGDQIFYQGAGRYMCADFIYEHGLRPKAMSIALRSARMERSAFWPALRMGIRDGFRRDSLDAVTSSFGFSPLLSADATEAVRKNRLFLPDWFQRDKNLPPGKCWQVIALSMPEAMHSIYAPEDDPEIVSPLLSQPLQELSLRISTPVFAFNGVERGLARLAFQEYLPSQILRRQSKGAISEYSKAIRVANAKFVTELLLDGILVNRGMVDRQLLEKTLAGDFTSGLGAGEHVLKLAAAEAWLLNWTRPQAKIAA